MQVQLKKSNLMHFQSICSVKWIAPYITGYAPMPTSQTAVQQISTFGLISVKSAWHPMCYVGHTSNAYRTSDQQRCTRRALAFPVNASRMHRIRTTIVATSEFREPTNRYCNRASIVYKQCFFHTEDVFVPWGNLDRRILRSLRCLCDNKWYYNEYNVILLNIGSSRNDEKIIKKKE